MRATSFIAFAICLVLALVIVDPGVNHAVSAVLLIGTAFPIDPLDRVMTLKEWRALRRISASTERRMRQAGLGPKITYLTHYLIGVRVRDDLAWMEAGGALGPVKLHRKLIPAAPLGGAGRRSLTHRPMRWSRERKKKTP
jgi:hypothetical protein